MILMTSTYRGRWRRKWGAGGNEGLEVAGLKKRGSIVTQPENTPPGSSHLQLMMTTNSWSHSFNAIYVQRFLIKLNKLFFNILVSQIFFRWIGRLSKFEPSKGLFLALCCFKTFRNSLEIPAQICSELPYKTGACVFGWIPANATFGCQWSPSNKPTNDGSRDEGKFTAATTTSKNGKSGRVT